MNKEILLSNINRPHTTELGVDRIKKNLKLDIDDVVDYCKNKVLDKMIEVKYIFTFSRYRRKL